MKVIKILRKISYGLLAFLFISLTISLIGGGQLEWSNPHFNRLWGFIIIYAMILCYILLLTTIKYFHKILQWILIIGILPTAYFSLGLLVLHNGDRDEQHYDRFILYQNMDKKNEKIIVQDYTNWKHHTPRVDTNLIKQYWLLRQVYHLDSIDLNGTWIKYSENGKVIDTIRFE